jgi:uncharacterized protein YecT (DUF1311 family)
MRRIAMMTAALLTAAPALAQTQVAMNRSAATTYARADAAMTREWRLTQAYMRGAGAGSAMLLLDSQRAWLKFRDAQCAIEGAEVAGGSMQPMTIAGCKTRLTTERTAQLRMLRWRR